LFLKSRHTKFLTFQKIVLDKYPKIAYNICIKRKRKPHFPRLMSVASPNGEWAVEDEIDSTL